MRAAANTTHWCAGCCTVGCDTRPVLLMPAAEAGSGVLPDLVALGVVTCTGGVGGFYLLRRLCSSGNVRLLTAANFPAVAVCIL